jgi:hypothetical protein
MRLRPGKSEHDLKRRSTLDPAGLFRRSDKGDKDDKATEFLAPERIAVSEDGGRPASSEVARPSASRDSNKSPPDSPRPANPRRFSMLRFRHASDSQLSTTAKEHAARDVPPVPPVPASVAERSNERM